MTKSDEQTNYNRCLSAGLRMPQSVSLGAVDPPKRTFEECGSRQRLDFSLKLDSSVHNCHCDKLLNAMIAVELGGRRISKETSNMAASSRNDAAGDARNLRRFPAFRHLWLFTNVLPQWRERVGDDSYYRTLELNNTCRRPHRMFFGTLS